MPCFMPNLALFYLLTILFRWSSDFHSFLKYALQKNPKKRPSSEKILAVSSLQTMLIAYVLIIQILCLVVLQAQFCVYFSSELQWQLKPYFARCKKITICKLPRPRNDSLQHVGIPFCALPTKQTWVSSRQSWIPIFCYDSM